MAKRVSEDVALRRQIGARVYFLRREQGVSALALATEVGMHRNTLYRIEAGMTVCSIGTLHKIARSLGVKMADFFENAPSRVHFASVNEK